MRRTVFVFLAVITLLLSACVIAVVDSTSQGQLWPKSAFDKNLDLEPGGSVSLENSSGNVEIAGWNDARIKISAEGGREAARSAGIYFLGSRFSPPDVQVHSTANSVRISTGRSWNEGQGDVVHYFLRLPHSVNLESIRNARGRISVSDIYGRALLDVDEGEIKVSNYSGSLDVRLGSGSVEAELLDLRPQDSVRIKVERGNIILLLEPSVGAQITADAPGGEISSELEVGQPLPKKSLSVKLGDGQLSIELTAFEGDIRIREVKTMP